ncbi:MAG: twin transmembrane helix small protein [Alphaproteobacteria bacterium]
MLIGLLIIALLSVVAALAFGVFALFKGGDFNRRYGNKAMRWRIILQAVALLIFTLALMFSRAP